MKLHALATLPHYVDHLLPIWRAVPPSLRGRFHAAGLGAARAQQLGEATVDGLPEDGSPVLVAANVDYRRVAGRAVYVNHGVGQSWRDRNGRLLPTGVGGPRPGVLLFLTPGPHATSVTLEANPGANVVETGPAKLDPWLGTQALEPDLLVVSTHWDHRVVPEARTALPLYLPSLKSLGVRVALHAHPRIRRWVEPQAAGLGLEFIPTFDEVLARAAVYATDCSSTLFEFAAIGRPVVVLNAPSYRRGHSHGLRFWEAASVGVQVNDPSELRDVVHRAFQDPPEVRAGREAGLRLAYAPLDGRATERAAAAIVALLQGQVQPSVARVEGQTVAA